VAPILGDPTVVQDIEVVGPSDGGERITPGFSRASRPPPRGCRC
jgi:hypothetical protein